MKVSWITDMEYNMFKEKIQFPTLLKIPVHPNITNLSIQSTFQISGTEFV